MSYIMNLTRCKYTNNLPILYEKEKKTTSNGFLYRKNLTGGLSPCEVSPCEV